MEKQTKREKIKVEKQAFSHTLSNRQTKKVVREFEEITVDQNGEFKEGKSVKESRIESEPNFVKLYLQDILFFNGIPKGISSVLFGLLNYMGYDHRIFVNSAMKKIIAQQNGLTFRTVHQAITTLTKNKVLIREETGLYVVNPYLIGKGDWMNIKEIRRQIVWSSEGRKFGDGVIINSDKEDSEKGTDE